MCFTLMSALLWATKMRIFNNCCQWAAKTNKVILIYSVKMCSRDQMTSLYFQKWVLTFCVKSEALMVCKKKSYVYGKVTITDVEQIMHVDCLQCDEGNSYRRASLNFALLAIYITCLPSTIAVQYINVQVCYRTKLLSKLLPVSWKMLSAMEL